jgi:hypothetical protein
MQLADLDSAAGVAIDHLHCRYLVPREHPAPERVASDLDHIVRTSLADACARALDRALDPRDPSVWVIRQIEFALTVDPGCTPEDQLGAAWGEHFARAIVGLILRGPDGESVLRYPHRAAWIAAFLRDLARGRAFELWQYRAFDSLRSLPSHAAAREALVREPGLIQDVLAALDQQQGLEEVMALLHAPDIMRVVEASVAVSGADGRSERETAGLLLGIWQQAGLRPEGDTYVNAPNLLRLLVRIGARSEIAWSERLVDVAGHLLAFYHLIRRAESPAHLISALALGDLRDAAACAGDSRYLASLPFLSDLAGGDVAWLRPLQEVMANPADLATAFSYYTPFGGLLMLLPLIAESGTCNGVAALTMLMKCAGSTRAVAVFDDPLLRRLAGVPPSLYARDLPGALPATPVADELADAVYFSFSATPFPLDPQTDLAWSAAASALLRRFAARLPGFARASFPFLYRNFLDCPASVSIHEGVIEARLSRPPLAVLLQMSGCDALSTRLPWLDDIELTVTLDSA